MTSSPHLPSHLSAQPGRDWGEGKGHQFSRSIKTEWLFPQLLKRKTTIFLLRLFLGPVREAGVMLICE